MSRTLIVRLAVIATLLIALVMGLAIGVYASAPLQPQAQTEAVTLSDQLNILFGALLTMAVSGAFGAWLAFFLDDIQAWKNWGANTTPEHAAQVKQMKTWTVTGLNAAFALGVLFARGLLLPMADSVPAPYAAVLAFFVATFTSQLTHNSDKAANRIAEAFEVRNPREETWEHKAKTPDQV